MFGKKTAWRKVRETPIFRKMDERKAATVLSRGLRHALESVKSGNKDAEKVKREVIELIEKEPLQKSTMWKFSASVISSGEHHRRRLLYGHGGLHRQDSLNRQQLFLTI